ncbi:MAG: LysM peptidoglycan-binding domain-containing protein [Anaerolineaceae bacterium]|nr:LysM peptidoglycan-binding domain-containing protein [Anaerolineaceae bacterium]
MNFSSQMRNKINITLFLLVLVLLFPNQSASGQDNPDNPVYIVQSGDTISIIASRFGISMDDLINANELDDPNSIFEGMQLIIPGLQDISGVLVTNTVPLGETFQSISLRYQFPQDLMIRLNRLTSPTEIYAGTSLIVPQSEQEIHIIPKTTLAPGQTLLELAVLQDKNPWTFVEANHLNAPSDVQPDVMLYLPAVDGEDEINNISPLIRTVAISPLPLVQGKTIQIEINTTEPVDLGGVLADSDLHFFQTGDNEYTALAGIHAMKDPGLVPVEITGKQNDTTAFDFSQMLMMVSGYYGEDPPLEVDPSTIDPAITGPEEDLIKKITAPITDKRYWDGIFQYPVDEPCFRSTFGLRRSFNGSDYDYFHAGLDFGVCANNLNIYAPASGVVVYTGLLTVRGNATVIDHGWGVYSGYWHQSEILVNVGDVVEPGQLIGQIGDTGRVTGPHLHWEIWVDGIQIDPVDWLDNLYPDELNQPG